MARSKIDLSMSLPFQVVDGEMSDSDVIEMVMKAAEASKLSDRLVGTVIDAKYKILSLLGEGGMGSVFSVLHVLLYKEMALKTFRTADLSAEAWQRFQREAQAIGKLAHPNIIQVFDFGISDQNFPYYTMELLTGESLFDRLELDKRLTTAQAISVFVPVADALAHAHRQGIVHRDIKPANIFLVTTPNGPVPKLVDFGLAKLASQDRETQSLTAVGMVFGSPLYMSPEQSRGRAMDERTDIYSFGCTLFHALTGDPPFIGDNPVEVVQQHQKKTPPRLVQIAPEGDFPEGLQAVVDKLMAKDVDSRYQTFEEVQKALSAIPIEKSPARPAARSKAAPAAGSVDVADRSPTGNKGTGSSASRNSAAKDSAAKDSAANDSAAKDSAVRDSGATDSGATNSATKDAAGKVSASKVSANRNSASDKSAIGPGAARAGQARSARAGPGRPGAGQGVASSKGGKNPSLLERVGTRRLFVLAMLVVFAAGALGIAMFLRTRGVVAPNIVVGSAPPASGTAPTASSTVSTASGTAPTADLVEQPEFSRYSKRLAGGETEFIFPATSLSLGEISWEGQEPVEATGTITVPAGKHVHLIAGQLLAQQPMLLRKFRANDLDELTFPGKIRWTGENFEEIGSLKGLQGINLTTESFRPTYIQYVNELPDLKRLDVTETGMSGVDLAGLKTLPQLTKLTADYIGDMQLVLEKLKKSQKMTDLSMKGCGLNDDDLKDIATMPNLEVLTLDYNTIGANGLKYLLGLEHLDTLRIESDQVKSDSVGILKNFKHLRHLRIQTAPWTEAEKEVLKKSLPNGCTVDEMI